MEFIEELTYPLILRGKILKAPGPLKVWLLCPM